MASMTMDDQQKLDFLRRFWPAQAVSGDEVSWEPYAEFLDYVGEELARENSLQPTDAATTIDTMFQLIEAVYQYRSSTFEQMIGHAEKTFPQMDRRALSRIIELAMRLSLTLNVQCREGPISTSITTLYWHGDRALDQLIVHRFWPSQYSEKDRVRVEQSFTAAFLVNVCGVRLRWSNNLADHLNFELGVLTIYQHKICLIRHARYESPIIPLEVLNEALQTLNLLFPFGDKTTRDLLIKEKKRLFYGLGLHFQSPPPDLSNLKFWRKEMMELYSLYRDPPHNWTQLFSDSRDKQQFATFWIAVLVLILTLVSIAFGSIQTVYSVKQYTLALAQACSVSGAIDSLPEFCRQDRR